MAVSLEHRAVPPEQTRKKPKMPKGRGIHIKINFGGEVAERGKLVDLETDKRLIARRSTPPPALNREDQEKPTKIPEPKGSVAEHVGLLIEVTAKEGLENRDVPTYNATAKKKPKKTNPQTTVEEKMLSRNSDVSSSTDSFAPPPPIPSAIVEENMATEVRDNVVPIAVSPNYVPPSKRKKERPSITPTGRNGWSLEEEVQESLVMPSALCGGPGSK